MIIKPAVRGFPRRFVGLPQPFAEPFAHQRMGVERICRWQPGASGSEGSTGASSRASCSRVMARRQCSSRRPMSPSVRPGIAGLARSALRQSAEWNFYASRKLGAAGSNLAAVSWLFGRPYETH